MKRIDESTFRAVKKSTNNVFMTNRNIAKNYGLSLKTVLQIRGSKNFDQYTEQNKAQHPPVAFSLGDEVLYLHRQVFRKNNDYIAPRTAKQAIKELQENI